MVSITSEKNKLHPEKPVINNLGIPQHHIETLKHMKRATVVAAQSPVFTSLEREWHKPDKKQVFSALSQTGRFIGGTLKFAATTGIIFSILFIAFNWDAYFDRFMFWRDSVMPASAELDPEQIAFNNLMKIDDPGTPSLSGEEVQSVEEIFKTPEVIDFENITINPSDYRVIIPRLQLNIPVRRTSADYLIAQDWDALEKQIQADLQHGIVQYPATANPGEVGNVFLTGHSSYYPWDPGKYKDVFALLDQLVQGDEIVVYYEGIKYSYKVFDVVVVSPNDTWVLNQPNDDSILTLMTCTPVGTNQNRLIVRLRQTSPDPANNKSPQDLENEVRINANLSA